MSVPRKIHLERLSQSQRKRRGRYLEAKRAKDSKRGTGSAKRTQRNRV
jgi:hypothetical protein